MTINLDPIPTLICDDDCIVPIVSYVRAGDAILLSGDVGRHGMAIMAVREGLAFESEITSDCAPLAMPVQALLAAGIAVHSLRDATRGGLAGALIEHARTAGVTAQVEEALAPVREPVQGACELLGLDPLYVANEGCFVAFVADADAERALAVMQEHPVCAAAVRIGTVTEASGGQVHLKSRIGALRRLDLLSGEQLPRIC